MEIIVGVIFAMGIIGLFVGVPWYFCYSDCLEHLKTYGYDPVECVKFSRIVLKPALKRYRKACAEKLGMQNKSEKFKF